MIPKIIHYCWFGSNEKTKELTCINSWLKHCPEFKIKEWNETNFDVNSYKYTKEAYKQKCWSKISNFVRLWALYHYGGIYLDTDVLILKNISSLLNNECFFGIEYNKKYPYYDEDFNATLFGTAIVGCDKKHTTIGNILDFYKNKEFTSFERTAESNNVLLITNLFKKDIINNCTIYSKNILYPDVPTSLSYTRHLKFDSWRENRL